MAEPLVVSATIASEDPVYLAESKISEILPLAAADLSRAEKGAVPVVKGHSLAVTDVIGQAHNVRVDGDALVADLEITDPQIQHMIAQGTRFNTSIGYDVAGYTIDGRGNHRATRWTLCEVSIVSVPADPRAGIGRSTEDAHMKTRTQGQVQPNAQQPPQQPTVQPEHPQTCLLYTSPSPRD